MNYGYVHLSTAAPQLAPYLAHLKATGCEKVLGKKIAGTIARGSPLCELGRFPIKLTRQRVCPWAADLAHSSDDSAESNHQQGGARPRSSAGETQRRIARSYGASQATLSRCAP